MGMPILAPRDIDFVLYELLEVESLSAYPRFGDHSRETFDAALKTARQIAEDLFATHNRKADLEEPRWVDGRVQLIPEVKQALAEYARAGFFAAHQDYAVGGMQLPWAVTQACMCWFYAANIATTAYAFLTVAAANLLQTFASEEQKARYLQPMLQGRFFGTMAMSEPNAGSSLGDVRTAAEPLGDGRYRLSGGKMWISGATHELSGNIVNLVLARIKGAPPGVKGLSLFIVPRYRVAADGSIGADNNVVVSGLNHKMGYRGTVNTVLNLGERGDCIGEIIGEPNQGLAYMFHMMNEARIVIGLSSAMLGYAGFRYSLDYARNRPQGRSPENKDPAAPQVPIVQHADVRRMLLAQKSYVESALALGLHAAMLVDRQKNDPDPVVREESGLLLEFLTPIIKAWSSDWSLAANSYAIQILGGYGYTRDYPVEQYWRDNRLNPIHEGTNGIQAIDLLGRKVAMQKGRALALFLREARASAAGAARFDALREYARALGEALDRLERTTAFLVGASARVGAARALANASPYLDLVGHTVAAWMWLRQALVASDKLPGAVGDDVGFYKGKLQACRYFYRWELPKTLALASLLSDLDATCFDMQDGWF